MLTQCVVTKVFKLSIADFSLNIEVDDLLPVIVDYEQVNKKPCQLKQSHSLGPQSRLTNNAVSSKV